MEEEKEHFSQHSFLPGQGSTGFGGAEHHDGVGFLPKQSSRPSSHVEEEDDGEVEEEELEMFDESIDRFEHSGFFPWRLSSRYMAGRCERGWSCTFAPQIQTARLDPVIMCSIRLRSSSRNSCRWN